MSTSLHFDEFGSSDNSQWKALVKKEIKEEEVFERLFNREIHGIKVPPVFTEAEPVRAFALHKTLCGVSLNHAFISESLIRTLAEYAKQQGAENTVVETKTPAMFSDLANITLVVNSESPFVNTVQGADHVFVLDLTTLYTERPQDELAFVLRNIDSLKANDAKQVILKLPVNSNFFFQVAKLRALRSLLADLYPGLRFDIQAVTSYYNKTLYDVNNNLLRNTTEALAAIVGGADILYVLPHDILLAPVSERSLGLAMNIHHLLRHESQLNEIPDVAEGSYYIEHLTASIRQQTQELYQGKTTTGELEAQIRSFSNGNPVIGVSKHPDKNEKIRDVLDRNYREYLLAFYGPHQTLQQEMERVDAE